MIKPSLLVLIHYQWFCFICVQVGTRWGMDDFSCWVDHEIMAILQLLFGFDDGEHRLDLVKHVVNIGWYRLNDGCLRLILWLFMMFMVSNGHWRLNESLGTAPKSLTPALGRRSPCRRIPEFSRRFPRTPLGKGGKSSKRCNDSPVIDRWVMWLMGP